MRTYFIATLIFLLAGCEEVYDWDLQESTQSLIAVEAVMTNEKINHRITLTRPYSQQNETPQPVSGATVTIISPNGAIPTTEVPAGSGKYYTDSIRFLYGIDYTLTITYGNNSYFATASQPPVEALPPKNQAYRKVDEGIYTLSYPETGEDPNYTFYYIYWKHLGGDCPGDTDCQAAVIQYDLKNVDIHDEFKPDQEPIYFPAGSIILRKKFSVSDAYREYLRGMLSETSWRGGVFDIYPANAATNLSEGAVGFFAVSSVVTDTLFVQP